MKTSPLRFLAALILSAPFFLQAQTADDEKLLFDAEVSRGVLASNGLVWTVDATGEDGDTASLTVKAKGPWAIAQITAPEESAGKRYLLSDGDMYFYRPGTRRPVSVPKRNQISGDAAIGDIASTSFLNEYQITETESGEFGGQVATVFTLDKKDGARPAYAKIKLWIATERRVALKAEFYTPSGKLQRTAEYQHDAEMTVGGKQIPFLSQLKVTEQIGNPRSTVLNFRNFEIKELDDNEFTVEALQEGF